MGTTFLIAWRNLVQAKRRTFLLSVALGAVMVLLVFLLALSQGLSDTMIRSATMFLAGHVNVAGFYKAKATDANPIITRRAEVRRIVEENTPGLDYIVDRQRGWARAVSETDSLFTVLSGIDVRDEQRFIEQIELAPQSDYVDGGSAKVLGDVKGLERPDTALIFAGQAKRLGLDIGDKLTITAQTVQGANNTGEVEIVAIGKDVGFMSNWTVFLTKETVRELYQATEDTTGAVMVYLKDPSKSAEVMAHLAKVLKDKGFEQMEYSPQPYWNKFERVGGEDWTGLRLDLTIWEDEVTFLQWTVNAVTAVSGLLVSILLVIIVIGIMNTMWIAVRERTQEIGTLRAIGMQRRGVLGLFVTEAFLLGLVATTSGALVGSAIVVGLHSAHLHVPIEAMRAILMSDVLNLVVRPLDVLVYVFAFTFITVLAALWPALKASKMQPVTAIHHAA